MKRFLLSFLVSLGLGNGASAVDQTNDQSDSANVPTIRAEKLVTPVSTEETAGHGGGGRPGPPNRPGPNRPWPIGAGPYRGGGYRSGRWYYSDGRAYPIYPLGWGWDRSWHPVWLEASIIFPAWIWMEIIPVGYWQCTSFNRALVPFPAIGQTMNQAAYNATYSCGGQAAGCYIPPQYCQFR